jgi:hypothetical protein
MTHSWFDSISKHISGASSQSSGSQWKQKRSAHFNILVKRKPIGLLKPFTGNAYILLSPIYQFLSPFTEACYSFNTPPSWQDHVSQKAYEEILHLMKTLRAFSHRRATVHWISTWPSTLVGLNVVIFTAR